VNQGDNRKRKNVPLTPIKGVRVMLNAYGPVGPTVKLGLDVFTGGVGEVYWGRQLTACFVGSRRPKIERTETMTI
jgi:hypothetical protein